MATELQLTEIKGTPGVAEAKDSQSPPAQPKIAFEEQIPPPPGPPADILIPVDKPKSPWPARIIAAAEGLLGGGAAAYLAAKDHPLVWLFIVLGAVVLGALFLGWKILEQRMEARTKQSVKQIQGFLDTSLTNFWEQQAELDELKTSLNGLITTTSGQKQEVSQEFSNLPQLSKVKPDSKKLTAIPENKLDAPEVKDIAAQALKLQTAAKKQQTEQRVAARNKFEDAGRTAAQQGVTLVEVFDAEKERQEQERIEKIMKEDADERDAIQKSLDATGDVIGNAEATQKSSNEYKQPADPHSTASAVDRPKFDSVDVFLLFKTVVFSGGSTYPFFAAFFGAFKAIAEITGLAEGMGAALAFCWTGYQLYKSYVKLTEQKDDQFEIDKKVSQENEYEKQSKGAKELVTQCTSQIAILAAHQMRLNTTLTSMRTKLPELNRRLNSELSAMSVVSTSTPVLTVKAGQLPPLVDPSLSRRATMTVKKPTDSHSHSSDSSPEPAENGNGANAGRRKGSTPVPTNPAARRGSQFFAPGTPIIDGTAKRHPAGSQSISKNGATTNAVAV